MAMSMGMVGSVGSCYSSSSSLMDMKKKNSKRGRTVICAASRGLADPYQTLRIQPGASETEVRRAFRQLALQYHPDVCKGNNCGVQFHQINEAYDIVMSSFRASEEEEEQWQSQEWGNDVDEPMRGMCDSDWDMWEEWMGWEGAGIRDYTSHINPYI
ncbi:chaperone protein dnaJ 8, chloroplastic [Iris pallida]|uniref:Chaperone protein dnaJ 8, chloroplastic n=1 Tax=Iris pallida TaxID=29817 RepID=A0AAX6IAD4_IRIPA|nr:chaperone protein dnaJ 8, chloroplastic [Iris pallida]KAJ6849817.1 chaperone protein dnaJ 8, chloroplastic [Iris pallida]